MKVLVLGGAGMLGHKMFIAVSKHFQGAQCTIHGTLSESVCGSIPLYSHLNTIQKVDVHNFSALQVMLARETPDVVINCVGVIKQREEAEDSIACLTVNSLLPHLLARWVGDWNGRIIHFSTDCVFSGSAGKYREVDCSDARDLYGRSKYLGEVATRNALTLRTSIIGRELSNFRSLLEWFLSSKGRSIRGFRRVMYSGVTTNYLADLVVRIIEEGRDLSGLFQISAPAISKYDLLCQLKAKYGLDVEIVPDDTEGSDRTLIGYKFRQATGYEEPRWEDLVSQLVSDKTPYDEWRGRRSHV